MNVFVFDIETIPDVDMGRKLYSLDNTSDAEVAQIMLDKHREQTESEFLPLYLHRVITIAAVLKTHNSFKIWTLGEKEASEKEIIERFFNGIEKYSPTLVSWNGTGFDLPVLHYRSLLHGIQAPRYWEIGDDDQTFRWNNYLNRYHYRHMDLMDILAGYQARANAPLDKIALLLGLPGKMGMQGSQVLENYLAGKLEQIRNYCEIDVLNTYLIYLRFCLMRGKLTENSYQGLLLETQNFLKNSNQKHFLEFLKIWDTHTSKVTL